MKKLKIIIADNDIEYSQRLFLALERKYSNLELTLSDRSGFGKLLQKRVYDIALFDASAYSDDLSLKNVKLPLVLLDEDTEESILIANKIGKHVLKYQRIDGIYRSIIGFFSEIDGSQLLNNGSAGCQVICFYSPAGGTGKTTISAAVSEMIANRGSRVLYMNFENIASYGFLFDAKAGKGLDEVIYQLDKGINMSMKINSLVKKSRAGVLYFDMFSNIMDVTEISQEKMTALLSSITNADICDYLIIDMDTSLSGINNIILNNADKIIIIETPDSMCQEKIRRLTSQKNMFEEYFSKAAVVRNKVSEHSGASITDLEVVSAVPQINAASSEKVIEEITKKSRLDISRILS